MKAGYRHIISILFIAVFLSNGFISLLSVITSDRTKSQIESLIPDNEANSQGEETKERSVEKELIGDEGLGNDMLFPLLNIYIKKIQAQHAAYWQNAYLPVFTPPPEV